jgi:hypothetical protein
LSPCAAVRKVDLDVNPWLQRILISLAAGSAASGVIVGTAKKPRRLKKRKKKKGEKDDSVQLGALALADAKLPEEHGLTAGEWRDAVVARGSSVASVFKRKPKAAVVDDGARVPDEVQSKDGKTVASTTAKKKKKKRRGKKDLPPATLWDSAKESFRQTVKETVREEVKETPIGGALDALKSVGAKVKEGASVVVENVEKVAKDVSEEVAKDEKGAAKDPKDTVGAKIGSKLSDFRLAIDAAIETVRKSPPPGTVSDAPVTPPAADGPPSAPDELAVQPGAVEEQRGAPVVEAELDPSTAAPSTKQPIDPEKVKQKLKSGFDAVSSWFQGATSPSASGATTLHRSREPGAPRRVRPANSDGDVVEAKDTADAAAAHAPAATDATDSPAASAAELTSTSAGDSGSSQPDEAKTASPDAAGTGAAGTEAAGTDAAETDPQKKDPAGAESDAGGGPDAPGGGGSRAAE